MASPIEVMDSSSSDAATSGDSGFTVVANPKKRPRGDSEPGSLRSERLGEATVTIRPVLSKQSVAKLNGLAVAKEINRIAGGTVAKVQKRSNFIIVTAHNTKQARSMTNETKFCGIEVAITMGRPVGSPKSWELHELEDKEILKALSTQGITAAKRILKKVGVVNCKKTTAIQVTFKNKMPETINFGYENYHCLTKMSELTIFTKSDIKTVPLFTLQWPAQRCVHGLPQVQRCTKSTRNQE